MTRKRKVDWGSQRMIWVTKLKSDMVTIDMAEEWPRKYHKTAIKRKEGK